MAKSTQSFLDKIFLPVKKTISFTVQSYIKDLEAKKFRDRFVLGVLENDVKWQTVDMTQSPNSLFVGAMGSGKSVGSNFSVTTWMLGNSDQTILFLVDPMKGANDYKALFEQDDKGKKLYEQVFPILSSAQQIIRLIDLLYDEAMARKDRFNEVQAESLYQYEKRSGKKMARLVTVMEEFHAIPFTIFNFDRDFKTEGTVANKFHTLMRIGRSYGIWFIACSQKATKSDIPPEIAPNFVSKQVFRVSRGEASYLLGDTKAADIRAEQKGRAMTELGAVQFPYLEQEKSQTISRLLKTYMRPYDAECAYLNLTIIKDYLEGRSTKDQYRLKKLTDLVKGIESNDAALIVTILHERQGQKVDEIDARIDQHGISHIVHWNNDIKVAVLLRCQAGAKKITGKHMRNIKRAMDLNECTHGIIYTSMNDLPNALYKYAVEQNIEVVDHEDMLRMAYKVELKGEEANLSPDQLASDAKESGDFQEKRGNKGDFEEDFDESEFTSQAVAFDDEVVDLDGAEKAKQVKKEESTKAKVFDISSLIDDDEDEEVPKVTSEEPEEEMVENETEASLEDVIKNIEMGEKAEAAKAPAAAATGAEFQLAVKTTNRLIKREKVTKVTTIRRDDTPSLLFHAQRTEAGEIYRVLFYILDNMELKHKFYVDRQIAGNLTFKEKQTLGVASTEEWNGQKEVCNPEKFDREILEYLENFSQCGCPVHSICWQQDSDLFKKYLKQCSYMINHSTIFEEYIRQFFNNNESREDLIKLMGIKPGKASMFTPTSIDFEIWKNTN